MKKFHVRNNTVYFGDRPLLMAITTDDVTMAKNTALALQAVHEAGGEKLVDGILKLSAENTALSDKLAEADARNDYLAEQIRQLAKLLPTP